ncbi:MAG: hypothetical protein E7658_06515 [Ruminococcaceae bacterium]|nr:hypothetical protein [Oscillospiraceae bacterium]
MREFFSENGKIIVKLMLNQFGAAVMGLMITLAAANSDKLMLFASIFASIFYVALLYSVIWEKGGQDRIKVDGGRAAYKPFKGLLMALIANIPNLVLAILIAVGRFFGSTDGAFGYEWAGNIYAVSNAIGRMWNAMYLGLIQTYMPVNPLAHFLDILPALFVCGFGYFLGLRNFRILGIFEVKKPKKESDKK